jgi:hypothetical protein
LGHLKHVIAAFLSVTACVAGDRGIKKWWLTTVYGPTIEADEPAFLDELHSQS